MDWASQIDSGETVVPELPGKFHARAQSRIVQNGDFAYVELTQGYWSRIDAADIHLVAGKCWNLKREKNGLLYARGEGGRLHLHQALVGKHPGKHTDHANGNGLDNVRSNIRVCPPGLNQMNKRKQRNSTYGTGVSLDKHYGKYIAHIKVGGKQKYLGSYATPEEASQRHKSVSREIYGEFSFFSRASEIENPTP